ncbi:MAG: putative metallo-hydrolase YflN [Syntrophorhabdaceae bacterium PtaU1.Bin034]|nr:MAG: putative metallo-hydrolase YflN [Syntrophorhabdaceae bacterium PtaU1.Bin034]
MVKLTESLFLIPGQDEMIPDSHVYLLGEPGSGDLSLVDAGLMGKGAYKLRSLLENGTNLSDIKRIIMTHTHLDHIGCIKEIIKEIPSLELWVHAEEAEPLEEGDERTVYGMDMFKQMCQMQYRLKDGDFTFKVNRWLKDNEELSIGGQTWTVLHIPGHSPGGIALYDGKNGVLIPGDVVYADYAIGRFDLHGANGQKLKNSLMRLGELNVKMLLPGHNRILKDVPQNYILNTAKQWGPYLG